MFLNWYEMVCCEMRNIQVGNPWVVARPLVYGMETDILYWSFDFTPNSDLDTSMDIIALNKKFIVGCTSMSVFI